MIWCSEMQKQTVTNHSQSFLYIHNLPSMTRGNVVPPLHFLFLIITRARSVQQETKAPSQLDIIKSQWLEISVFINFETHHDRAAGMVLKSNISSHFSRAHSCRKSQEVKIFFMSLFLVPSVVCLYRSGQ